MDLIFFKPGLLLDNTLEDHSSYQSCDSRIPGSPDNVPDAQGSLFFQQLNNLNLVWGKG